MEDDIERIQIAAQATCLSLLELLLNDGSYAAKLGGSLKIDSKVVAFHLKVLEKVGLVKGEYIVNKDNRPVAIKRYEITSKGRRIHQHIISFK